MRYFVFGIVYLILKHFVYLLSNFFEIDIAIKTNVK